MTRFASVQRWGPAAALILAAIGYFMLIDRPSSAATAALRESISAKQRYIVEAEQLRSRIEQAELDIAKAQAHRDGWRDAAPKAQNVASYYGEIHHVIRGGGAAISRFEPQPPIELASLREVPISVTFDGTHAAVAKAVVGLEKAGATIWVRDVRLSPLPQDAKKVQCEARLVLFADNSEKLN